MKKTISLLLSFLSVVFLCSCSAPINRLQDSVKYERLWDIDIALDGYVRSRASHSSRWVNDDISMNLIICPETLFDGVVLDGVVNHWETITQVGRTYYTRDSALSWDSEDSYGTNYIREVMLFESGLVYDVQVMTVAEALLETITVKEIIELMNNPRSDPKGFEKEDEHWDVELNNGDICVSITIYVPPFGTKQYEQYTGFEEFRFVQKNGNEYLERNRERNPDDPNVAAIVWRNEIGLIELGGGIPYDKRNDLPSDALDFINIETAQSVVAQILNE